MRAPQIVKDFLEWRWAPCVALTVGSLAYVGLAVLIIPSRIDADAHAADSTTPFNAPNTQPNTAFASSLTPNSMAGNVAAQEAMRHPQPAPAPPPQPPQPQMDTMSLARRGFSPPIEQPEAPPPPAPLVQAPPPPVPMQLAAPPPPTVGIPPPMAPQVATAPAPSGPPPASPPPVPSEAAIPPQPQPQ